MQLNVWKSRVLKCPSEDRTTQGKPTNLSSSYATYIGKWIHYFISEIMIIDDYFNLIIQRLDLPVKFMVLCVSSGLWYKRNCYCKYMYWENRVKHSYKNKKYKMHLLTAITNKIRLACSQRISHSTMAPPTPSHTRVSGILRIAPGSRDRSGDVIHSPRFTSHWP